MMMPDLIRELMSLIASRHGVFHWAAPSGEIGNTCDTLGVTEARELYFREFYRTPRETDFILPFSNHKFWPAATSVLQHRQVLRTDRRTFLHSDFYNLLWRVVDIDEPLLMIVREPGRTHGILYVYRAVGEPPFEPSDVKLLQSISGFVAHSMTRAALHNKPFTDSDDRALFIADLGGYVTHASPAAQHLLSMALNPRLSPSAQRRGLHGPIPEIRDLCRALSATANDEIGQPPPVLRLRNPWGEFVLRAYWFGATDGAEQTRQIGVTVERRVPRVLALRRRIEDLPLTGREKQLCLLLAHDRSRHDLADVMGVSAATVTTHQRSVYAKLGVHSRAGLLSALLPG